MTCVTCAEKMRRNNSHTWHTVHRVGVRVGWGWGWGMEGSVWFVLRNQSRYSRPNEGDTCVEPELEVYQYKAVITWDRYESNKLKQVITWDRYELRPVRTQTGKESLHETGMEVTSQLHETGMNSDRYDNSTAFVRMLRPAWNQFAITREKLPNRSEVIYRSHVNRNKDLYGDRSEVVPVSCNHPLSKRQKVGSLGLCLHTAYNLYFANAKYKAKAMDQTKDEFINLNDLASAQVSEKIRSFTVMEPYSENWSQKCHVRSKPVLLRKAGGWAFLQISCTTSVSDHRIQEGAIYKSLCRIIVSNWNPNFWSMQ